MVRPASDHSLLDSQPSLSSSKRKKLDDDDTPASTSKKPRTRVSFSCGECHRRKQKCNRQIPCDHCVARKVPELCKAYTPGKADHDISARLSRLEHIIEMALPQFCSPGTPSSSIDSHPLKGRRRSPSVTEDDNHSQGDDQDPTGGSFQSGKWYGNSASGSIAPGSVIEQLQNAVMPSTSPIDEHQASSFHRYPELKPPISHSSSNGITGSINPVAQELEPTPADKLKSLVQECGVSPHKISELLQELPPQRLSDVLIDYYFKSINWTRYPISERDFRAGYNSIAAHGAHGIGATNPNDVRFLPLLFVILAISVRLAPEDIGGDARTRRVTSLRYYWSSRRSLLIAAAIQPDSLDIVLIRLLSARFLTFDRRITECWSQLGAAVRTAQALGLHRDGSSMGMDSVMVEYRRRIWSYLYHADRSYALVLGRPNSIQDDYTSTLPPSNIEDETAPRAPLPLSSPTPMTFLILRHQLAYIIGHIVHHFQKVKSTAHYSEVGALDDELLKFTSDLPPHFALEPDKSLDETRPYIPIHRFLLITEILFVRTSLHRPYILRKLNSDRYARSRAACFESALKDFEVRQEFRQVVPKEVRDSLSNAYREFQTAMVSGIYLVLEPTGKDTEAMHAILDGFMKDHEGLREVDETTRRELKTIEFLKSRSLQRTQEASSNTSGLPDGANSENPAHLLLNLHQPSTPISSSQTSFPSLINAQTGYSSQPRSPAGGYSSNGLINRSPTFQRLHSSQGEFAASPTASGSPSGEEDTTAQSLLDHWCGNYANDGSNINMAWGGPGSTDFSPWPGGVLPITNSVDSSLRLEGSEWNYWETLVNQIQRPGP